MMTETERATQAKEASPFLTIWEASKYLKISERALKRMRTKGTGPKFHNHSRRILYHIDDLIAWADARKQGGEA